MKKILYISTSIPSLTLTFVYREIQELKSAGYDIITISMKKPRKECVSEEASELYKTTSYLDQVLIIKKILAQIVLIFFKPRIWFRQLKSIFFETEIKGRRDRIKLLYHFLEAGYIYLKLRQKAIEHIHAHFLTGPTSIAIYLSEYLYIPYSFTMHASLIYVDPLILGTKLLRCKSAVTISKYNKDYLISKYGRSFDRKIKIIHCGINIDAFYCPGGITKIVPPVVLAVGQLTGRKGFYYLLEACSILRDSNILFYCCIIGDDIIGDGEKEILMEKYISLKLTDCVTFMGRQPQDVVKENLLKASIFVLPSIVTSAGMREGIPVSLMEAMAMKLPVVTTKTVGIPELVENGKEGFLVDQKNSQQIACALKRLIENDALRIRMGQKGREKIEKAFNISNIPSLFDDIFN